METITNMNKNTHTQSGFSLIEMLVVIFVFSLLAILLTQSLTLTLRSTKKSDSIIESRENIQFALNVMERQIRNARGLTCPAPDTPSNTLSYIDEYGNNASFTCTTSGSDSFIASNSASARLTSNKVRITNCSQVFTCNAVDIPHSVDITITGGNATVSGVEGSSVSLTTKVLLRNY